jgi:hypothetical protein
MSDLFDGFNGKTILRVGVTNTKEIFIDFDITQFYEEGDDEPLSLLVGELETIKMELLNKIKHIRSGEVSESDEDGENDEEENDRPWEK